MEIKGRALGLIETYGYIGAVEASDVALKSAQVELLDIEKVKGGYVTTKFVGDVSAVKAAVDAAEQAVRRMNVFVSSHVIARPSDDLEQMLFQEKHQAVAPAVQKKEIVESKTEIIEENIVEIKVSEDDVQDLVVEEQAHSQEDSAEHKVTAEIVQEIIEEVPEVEQTKSNTINNESTGREVKSVQGSSKTTDMDKMASKRYTEKELQAMKVVRLRGLARNLEGISLERKDIKFANKKKLVDAIMQFYGRKKE